MVVGNDKLGISYCLLADRIVDGRKVDSCCACRYLGILLHDVYIEARPFLAPRTTI